MRPHFTARQLEIVSLVRAGLTRRQIAQRLGVREETVRGHVRAIERKLPNVSRGLARIRLFASEVLDRAA